MARKVWRWRGVREAVVRGARKGEEGTRCEIGGVVMLLRGRRKCGAMARWREILLRGERRKVEEGSSRNSGGEVIPCNLRGKKVTLARWLKCR